MPLLTNEPHVEELLSRSLQSRQINYRPLRENRSRVGQYVMSDGGLVEFRYDGHRQFLISRLPATFEQQTLEKLFAGHGAHPPIDPSMRGELVFRLPDHIKIGDTIWVQCYFQGKFFCAFGLPGLVMSADLVHRVPQQR